MAHVYDFLDGLDDDIISDFLSNDVSRQKIALRHMQFSYVRDPINEIIDRTLVYRLVEFVSIYTCGESNDEKQAYSDARKLLIKAVANKEGMKQVLENGGLYIICNLSLNNSNSTIIIDILKSYYTSIYYNQPLFAKQIDMVTNTLIKYMSTSLTNCDEQHCIHVCNVISNHCKLLTLKQMVYVIEIIEGKNIKYTFWIAKFFLKIIEGQVSKFKYQGIGQFKLLRDQINKDIDNQNSITEIYKTLSNIPYNNEYSYLDNIVIFMQNQSKLLCHGFTRKQLRIHLNGYDIIQLCIKYVTPLNPILIRLTNNIKAMYYTPIWGHEYTSDHSDKHLEQLKQLCKQFRYNTLDIIANIECNHILIELINNYKILKEFIEILMYDDMKNKILTLW
eukprot:310079_1